MGLVTSGNRERVSQELEQCQIEDFFAARVYFEDTKEKKPHPEPLLSALAKMGIPAKKSAYVGDRPEDILMGRQTGAFTIGVESAYATRTELESAAPDLIFPDAGYLPEQFGPRRVRS
jgi:phosphoglycolate phosphatase-like HAD superfamily hydrolase